ncbi:MAG: DNA alkylation repair protein [Myxococcales bacterium]|nr:DNA alkylation repair protein [Myxococcales bacterium]
MTELVAEDVQRALRAVADPSRASVQMRFFKAGPGEYGEGDVFIGVQVPVQRKVAKTFESLPTDECARLLASEVHEDRLTALLVLVRRMQRARGKDADAVKRAVYRCFIANRARVNNWDLVDTSAEHIVGPFAIEGSKERAFVDELSRAESLWDRRIAMMSTFYFIKRGDFSWALEVAARLLEDEEDLLHKASGWMLREIGGRGGLVELRAFLRAHAAVMPRTMLRYAIEKLPEAERKKWLAVKRA